MKIKVFLTAFLVVVLSAAAIPALAICPVCTVAVGAGLGLSRWIGVDDTISGIWVGAFLASLTMWTINWFEKRNIRFKFRNTITAVVFYIITIIPLYYTKIIGHELNALWGIDKLVLGIAIGTAGFIASALTYLRLKGKNDNRAYFPFQKIAMALGILTVLSAIFFYITR